MESQHTFEAMAAFSGKVAQGANAEEIINMLVWVWQEIDAVLCPVIGQRGVAALYQRSLHLVLPAYPWLADAYQGMQGDIDLAALKHAFECRSSDMAAAGGGALLRTFHGLLSGVIGPALAQRLLCAVWTNPSSDSAMDDRRS